MWANVKELWAFHLWCSTWCTQNLQTHRHVQSCTFTFHPSFLLHTQKQIDEILTASHKNSKDFIFSFLKPTKTKRSSVWSLFHISVCYVRSHHLTDTSGLYINYTEQQNSRNLKRIRSNWISKWSNFNQNTGIAVYKYHLFLTTECLSQVKRHFNNARAHRPLKQTL